LESVYGHSVRWSQYTVTASVGVSIRSQRPLESVHGHSVRWSKYKATASVGVSIRPQRPLESVYGHSVRCIETHLACLTGIDSVMEATCSLSADPTRREELHLLGTNQLHHICQ